MAKVELIKCIFCFQNRESSKEHVLPRTLGGNLTIMSVCADCNTSLSHLDQSLAESSILTMNWMTEQPGANIHAKMVTDQSEIEIKLGNKFISEIKAQISFIKKTDGSYKLAGTFSEPNQQAIMFKNLRKQIKKKGVRSITILSGAENRAIEAGFSLVQNRSNEIIFRPSSKTADSQAEYEEMAILLENKFDEIEETFKAEALIAKQNRIDRPNVTFSVRPNFGLNFRGCAKIAYTFLCHLYGDAFVMDSKFDEIRNYILNGEGADDSGALWLGAENKEDTLRPSRYVAWLQEYHQKTGLKFSSPNKHVVCITPMLDRFWVMVDFYGQHVFAVDIGSPNITSVLPLFYEFDFVLRTHRQIPLEDLMNAYLQDKQ